MLACASCCNAVDDRGEIVAVTQQQTTPGIDIDERFTAGGKPAEVLAVLAVPAPVAEKDVDFGPDRQTREFAVRLFKESGKGLGLDISAHDGVTLLLGRVKDGPVNTWNNAGGRVPFEKVRRGDRIVSANNAGGNSDLILETLKQSTSDFTVVIRRVTQFRVAFDKQGSLGLEHDSTNCNDLFIKVVKEGAFKDANKKSKADLEMRATDQIIQVNGQTGSAQKLLGLLESATSLDMLIRRSQD